MRFVVSGGAGFMGSHIVDGLIDRGIETFIVDDLSTGLLVNINGNSYFSGPYDVGETPNSWMDEETIAIHCASQPKCNVSLYAPLDDLENNYRVGVKFLVKCVSRSIKRFVLISSNSVYGKQTQMPYTEDMVPAPRDPYAVHKFALEQISRVLCINNNVEYVILRPQHVFGPRQRSNLAYRNVISRWIKKALLGEPLPVFGNLDLKRAFSPVSLISRAVIAAAFEVKAVGQVLNLGSENLRSLQEVSTRISNAINKPVTFQYLPPPPTLLTEAYGSVEKMKKLLGTYEDPDEFDINFFALVEELKNTNLYSQERGILPELQADKYDQTYNA